MVLSISKESNKIILSTVFISLCLGLFETIRHGSLINLIGHISLGLISGIIIVIWIGKVKFPFKYLGFLLIGVTIFLHSIANQYHAMKYVTEQNDYLISIAKFLTDYTPLKTQPHFASFIFSIAIVLTLYYHQKIRPSLS